MFLSSVVLLLSPSRFTMADNLHDPYDRGSNDKETGNQTAEEEETLIVFDEEDVEEGLQVCKNSVVGKILTEKPIHKGSLQSALANIWCNPKGFRMEEIEDKLYQFFLEEEKDAKRILQGSPWIFRNSWLIVKEWDRATDPKTMEFSTVLIWIQLWGLPPHCRTRSMGMKIGSCLGEVLESELFEFPEKRIINKIKVALDIAKPIKAGANAGSRKDGVFWIEFRYEKLPQFCFFCGVIGHGEQGCQKAAQAEKDQTFQSKNLGPWLRTTQMGRRMVEDKGKNSPRTKEYHEERTRDKKNVSTEVLERFSKMTMQEKINLALKTRETPASESVPTMQHVSKDTTKDNTSVSLNMTNIVELESSGPTPNLGNVASPLVDIENKQDPPKAIEGTKQPLTGTKKWKRNTQPRKDNHSSQEVEQRETLVKRKLDDGPTDMEISSPKRIFSATSDLTAEPARQACRQP